MSWLLLAWGLAIGLPASAQPAAAEAARPILVFGDSLSAGYGVAPADAWVRLLQERITTQGYGLKVVNASVSGETTSGGLARLPHALAVHHPALVILELGGNDGLRGLPTADMENNLAHMVALSRAAGARVLVAGMRMPPNYGERYTHDFAAVYTHLGQRYRVPEIPFLLDGIALDPALMQADGIHPNERGQPRLLDNVWKYLEPMLGPRHEHM